MKLNSVTSRLISFNTNLKSDINNGFFFLVERRDEVWFSRFIKSSRKINCDDSLIFVYNLFTCIRGLNYNILAFYSL